MHSEKKEEKDKDKEFIINNTFLCKKKISSGSFGVVHMGVHTQTNENVAIKLEKNNNEDEILSVVREATILAKLSGIRGIPKVYWSGTQGEYDVMVISLLGRDLGSYLKIFKKFSLKSSILLADQLLKSLEAVHEKGILHRDIKPENILMGRGTEKNTVYFVDFGISKYFKDSKGRHIPFRENKSFIAAHLGQEQSRKDDLESLGYVVVFFLKGILPWQNLNVSEKDKTKKVGEVKQKTSIEELCKGLPEEFIHFFNYVKSLGFQENPDYEYLKGLFKKIAVNGKFDLDDAFDWNKIEKKPPKPEKNEKSRNDIKQELMDFKVNIKQPNNNKLDVGSKDNMLNSFSFLEVPNYSNVEISTDNSRSQISKASSIRVINKNNEDFNDSHFDGNEDDVREFPNKNLVSMMAELEKKKVIV